jgi:8-amino-7-oxononanoate synthase
MSQLRKHIRNKRFDVKPGKLVRLIISLPTGELVELEVKNCSQNGLFATIDKRLQKVSASLENDMIVNPTKIVWEKSEISLGRLVLRRVSDKKDIVEFAFSTIDIGIPIEGELSKLFDINFSNDNHSTELGSDKFNLSSFIENEYSNVDLFDRVREFSIFFREWEKTHKYGYNVVREKSKGNRVNIKRKRKNGRTDYLMMGSNDYLGLSCHPEVIEAAKSTLDSYGFGSTGSPVTTGLTDLHLELAERIAKLHQKESAVLFNSGYAANIGIITALSSTNDLIIADQLCHRSIQDALSQTKAKYRYFLHNNPSHLENLLSKEREKYNGCLIITEGVFSMDGDVAKLDEIYSIARKYNARVMVDQAHCFGVIGPRGLGVADKFDLLRDVDVIMGTFSKICGGIGGFATGSKEVINWIKTFASPFVFSVSLPPSNVAAVSKALEIFQRDLSLLNSLKTNIKHFVDGLNHMGFKMDPTHEAAIVPVVIGDEGKLGIMYQSLLDDGIWCVPIVYPGVAKENCRFRFTVMATHTRSDLDYALLCLEKAMMKAKFTPSKLVKGEEIEKIEESA